MNEIILTGIFTLVGVAIGGVFTLLSTKLGQKNEQKTKDLQNLISQWETFYEIEQELVKQLVKQNNELNEHSLKNTTRAVVYNKGFKDLSTPSQIKTIRNRWN